MGKLQEFEILFDHPQAVYKAGEVVQGRVIVQLAEPMRMRSEFAVATTDVGEDVGGRRGALGKR